MDYVLVTSSPLNQNQNCSKGMCSESHPSRHSEAEVSQLPKSMVSPRGALEIRLTQFSPTYKPEFPSSHTSFLMCLQGSHRALMPTQRNGDPKMPLAHSSPSARKETATQCPQDVQRNCSSKPFRPSQIQ